MVQEKKVMYHKLRGIFQMLLVQNMNLLGSLQKLGLEFCFFHLANSEGIPGITVEDGIMSCPASSPIG